MGAAGIQTNALVFSGRVYPGASVSTATELYDGTSWNTTANVSTGRSQGAGAGTVANGLFFGGGAQGAQTEEYTAEVVQLGYKTISDS